MDLVLHAGMHKTGTSSFQKLLQAWATPQDCEAWVLPSQLNVKNSQKFDPDWISRRLRSGLKHVVISHEGLSTFSTAHWKQLRKAIPSHIEPRIIIVFRPWRDFLISRWSTCCMRRDSSSFHRYIRQLIDSKVERVELDHSLCIKRPISAGFQHVECIDYEANVRKEKSILPILCRRAGIPDSQEFKHYNKRPEREIIEILRMLNGARSDMEKRGQDDLFVSLGEHRPVDKFFDQMKLLQTLKQKNPILIALITTKLNDANMEIRNQRLEYLIQAKQDNLCNTMRPWIVGEKIIRTNEIDLCPHGQFSKLEYHDLEKEIKDELKNAIEDADNPISQ